MLARLAGLLGARCPLRMQAFARQAARRPRTSWTRGLLAGLWASAFLGFFSATLFAQQRLSFAQFEELLLKGLVRRVVVERGAPREVMANPQHERTKAFLSKVM